MNSRTPNSPRQTIKAKTDLLTFGKHKGHSIEFVLATEPSYVLWLNENGVVEIPDSIVLEAEENDGYDEDPDWFVYDGWKDD